MITKHRYKNFNYYTACNYQRVGQPIIIHIHGAGSRGNDLDLAIEANPIVKRMNLDNELPFKIYAPQCQKDTWFEVYEQLLEFIDFVKLQEPNSQIFLTGMSMGGYCAWQLLASKPNFFKKAVICCGGGMYWNAESIKTPVKIFHGKLDDTVFVDESVKMYEAVIKCGLQATLTVYDDLAHNCWDRAFEDKETYEWLLK